MSDRCRFCKSRPRQPWFNKNPPRIHGLCRECNDRGRTIQEVARWAGNAFANVGAAAVEEMRYGRTLERLREDGPLADGVYRDVRVALAERNVFIRSRRRG